MASSKREEERNEKIIRGLMKLPPNRRCINCNALGPQYVCTNFWTFVCMICSGIHREFTHRVKSVSMSKFTSQEVDALQNGGNQRAREIYLKDWDLQRQRLPNTSDADRVREFIKAVYVDRRYAGGNKSEKPPREMQSERSIADETRRASSYHSYSQSPPYDFQYEDRLNRKQGGSLSRKPGSDRGLYDRKAASFVYSPGRLSEHLYEDRFANEGSSSRVSDYSASSVGDPFRSAPHSPNLQEDNGLSSPTYDSSRKVVDGLQRQTSSTYTEEFGVRDADKLPVPRPQRTMSSGSFGSLDKNPGSLHSPGSYSLFDAYTEAKQSAATIQNNVSTFPPLSQLSAESSSGLNLSKDPVGTSVPNSAPAAVDLFQVPTGGSVASIDLFQTPEDSSVLSQNSLSSFPSYFSENFQNLSVSNVNQKGPQPSEPSNEGWATFDSPQPTEASTDTLNTAVSQAHSENGLFSTILDSVSSTNAGLQWPDFQSNTVHGTAPLVSNLWNDGSPNICASANMASSQPWKAFDEAHEQKQHVDLQGVDLQVSVGSTSSNSDQFVRLKTSEDSSIDGDQKLASPEAFSFPTLPSHFASGSLFNQSIHPFMSDVAIGGQKSSNPFDISFDSQFEANNAFLDMSTMQATLPGAPLPSPYAGGINDSWFSSNPLGTQGGVSYITAQTPSSQLPNVPTHGPVASVGGNPFA